MIPKNHSVTLTLVLLLRRSRFIAASTAPSDLESKKEALYLKELERQLLVSVSPEANDV